MGQGETGGGAGGVCVGGGGVGGVQVRTAQVLQRKDTMVPNVLCSGCYCFLPPHCADIFIIVCLPPAPTSK